MTGREKFEAWTRKFYSDLACASDTFSDGMGTYSDFAHHMAWHLWQDIQSHLESLENDAAQMHDEIINLRVNEDSAGAPYTNWREAYLWGHRDARHAAAELVTAMQSQGSKND